ncbi:MAG: ABC transporter permease [Actinomycetota bacterium]|nr:MAG: ABC transporter permease [Actinomycetota bacterium]
MATYAAEPAAPAGGSGSTSPAESRQRAPRRFVILRALFRSRRSKVLALLLVVLIVLALLAPWIAPYGENEQNLFARLQGPSAEHLLGTDRFGRDILTLLLYGLRLSLAAGAVAVSVAVVLGVPTGMLAGWRKGWFASVANTVADVLLSIPGVIFALSVIAILGPGLVQAMVAVGLLLSPRFFRIARATTQSVRERSYMEAARAAGCSTPRMLVRHALPNSMPPLLVQATFGFGFAVVVEAGLSFLGLGTQPPASSLGTMISSAFTSIGQAAWPIFPPSILLGIVIYLVASLGDEMQDSLRTGGGI